MKPSPTRDAINEQSFNEEFLNFMRQICTRPGMWVGRTNFELVCAFINGMISAVVAQGLLPKLQHWEFVQYIQKRYGVSKSVVWMSAYSFPGDWTEEQKLGRLLEDYEDFVNPLTRMVVETSDVVEDA